MGTMGSGLPTGSNARLDENSSGCFSTNSAVSADTTMYPPRGPRTTGPASRTSAYAAVRLSAIGSADRRTAPADDVDVDADVHVGGAGAACSVVICPATPDRPAVVLLHGNPRTAPHGQEQPRLLTRR